MHTPSSIASPWRGRALPLILAGALPLAAAWWAADRGADAAHTHEPASYPANTVQITSATFGMNCSGQVKRGLGGVPRPMLGHYEIAAENATRGLRAFCAGQPVCSFRASAEVMKLEDPAAYCPKELVMQYRCFSYDVRREARAMEGAPVALDCRNAMR